jgi:hypothetical protein
VLVSPVFWSRSSASKAVPRIPSVGAVSFKLPRIRYRRIWSCFRNSANWRARRAWARPWPCRVIAAPAWRVVGASWRTRYPSVVCSSQHNPDSGRLENALAPGTSSVPRAHSGGRSIHAGGDGVPATGCKYYRPVAGRSGSQACGYDITSSTVATHEPIN